MQIDTDITAKDLKSSLSHFWELVTQKEFKSAQKHIDHLCRNLRIPGNKAGYRILNKYGKIETQAMVGYGLYGNVRTLPIENRS